MFIPEHQLYMCPYENCRHNEWQNAFSDQDWCNMHKSTCPYRTDVEVSGALYLGVVDDQQPSQLQDLTGQGPYHTDSLVRNHGAIPGGSGFTPLALPVPQSLLCLPHNMSRVEASHFITFLWLHACWKPE
jgi:hypothetical protein